MCGGKAYSTCVAPGDKNHRSAARLPSIYFNSQFDKKAASTPQARFFGKLETVARPFQTAVFILFIATAVLLPCARAYAIAEKFGRG